MVSNLRISVAVLVVTLLLAAAGLTVLTWLAAGALERLADWWRDRRIDEEPAGSLDTLACDAEAPDGDLCWFDRGHDGQHAWELRLGLGLAPERTWEQMTSHQLPVVQESGDGQRGDASDYRGPGWPVNGALTAARERRAPWWEVQQRAAYESLGLDYPSGLMARVRELTP